MAANTDSPPLAESRRRSLAAAFGSWTLLAAALAGPPLAAATRPPDLVLLTLDTTRADHLGCYGAAGARTPVLDALATRGVRYRRALTPVPLTLPAHASLLTGLDPPEHGVRDNGVAVLPAELPTLATLLAGRGYSTGAFVASRVLDRRFGLDRGFAVYDDSMPAEQIGEYGYPERDAAQVTDAALAWAAKLPAGKPYLLWVHFYDPHAPYSPPREFWADSDERRYAGEIAYVDREIGRLLAGLPGDASRRLVAAVGDHGEALGEHGERAHGILLYRASLEVPLIVAGPGVPAGRVVETTVGIRRLAPTLLALAGFDQEAAKLGRPLPTSHDKPEPVYGETEMPATVYGWSPLEAISEDRFRLVVGPRPALFDFVADPAETRNLLTEKTDVARRLKRALTAMKAGWTVRKAEAPLPDAQLDAALRSLGYLGGARSARGGTIDPNDGIAMLGEFERAKEVLAAGRAAEAAASLRELVKKSPGNLPFLTNLGSALLHGGRGEEAIAVYRQAIELNPGLDFPHLNLAGAYQTLGRPAEARREYELVLELNPRSAAAWLQLAEIATGAGSGGGGAGRAEAIRLLRRAVAAGTESATVYTRLAELELAAGDRAAAERDLREATRVAPRWARAWAVWGDLAADAGRPDEAFDHYVKASLADPYDPAIFLRLGLIQIRRGQPGQARQYLQQVLVVAPPDSPAAREARRLIAGLR